MNVEPIGVVRNEVRDARDEGWGSVVSEIVLRPELAAGLRGLEEFSHAMIVFAIHRAEFSAEEHLQRRPRNRAEMPLLGVFAQRTRHRPNRIGITAVAVERIEGASLFVRGLDAIDGTPILDIKPHVPLFDAPANATVPAWISRLLTGYFQA